MLTEPQGEVVRYQILETIRQYAHEELEKSHMPQPRGIGIWPTFSAWPSKQNLSFGAPVSGPGYVVWTRNMKIFTLR